MTQLSIRLDDELARQVKEHAAAAGRSVNGWVTALVRAAVDPDYAGSDAERTRERLARAGLLEVPEPRPVQRPDEAALRRARRAAGRGTPLSRLVAETRD